MKITSRHLLQIIREELLREAAAEASAPQVKASEPVPKTAEGVTHQVDASGRAVTPGVGTTGGMSLQLTVQGLSDPELTAMKKMYDVTSSARYYLGFKNVSSETFTLHARGIPNYAGGGAFAGRFGRGEGLQGFMPITGYATGSGALTAPVELGASRVTFDEKFWSSDPYILKLTDIAPDAAKLVTGDDAFPAALITMVVGTGRAPTGDPEPSAQARRAALALPDGLTAPGLAGWIAGVTKSPLRLGSRGPGVKITQQLLKAYFVGSPAVRVSLGAERAGAEAVRAAADAARLGVTGDSLNHKALGEKISTDSVMGPITRLAVLAFQLGADLDAVDGVVGAATAQALVAQFNNTDTVTEHVTRRWGRLAGLLVD